ncbi:hypothetical protein B0H13DRAFT_648104 [Mycena leptocephala]|nr:hypothetical protein B0H13DRAFT_648104 [Mycena leptocephala]
MLSRCASILLTPRGSGWRSLTHLHPDGLQCMGIFVLQYDPPHGFSYPPSSTSATSASLEHGKDTALELSPPLAHRVFPARATANPHSIRLPPLHSHTPDRPHAPSFAWAKQSSLLLRILLHSSGSLAPRLTPLHRSPSALSPASHPSHPFGAAPPRLPLHIELPVLVSYWITTRRRDWRCTRTRTSPNASCAWMLSGWLRWTTS